MTKIENTDDLMDALAEELENSPGIYMLAGMHAKYKILGAGLPLPDSGQMPDDGYVSSKAAELIDDMIFDNKHDIPSPAIPPKRIDMRELEKILEKPGTRVKVSWGTPNPKTRIGCYIMTQLGLMHREFFVGMDVQTGDRIIEIVG